MRSLSRSRSAAASRSRFLFSALIAATVLPAAVSSFAFRIISSCMRSLSRCADVLLMEAAAEAIAAAAHAHASAAAAAAAALDLGSDGA